MISRLAEVLHQAIEAVAPITGVSLGDINDKLSWVIHFKPEATDAERVNARAVLMAFDPLTDQRSRLAKQLDTALMAVPSIDPRIKAVFEEWRKQVI